MWELHPFSWHLQWKSGNPWSNLATVHCTPKERSTKPGRAVTAVSGSKQTQKLAGAEAAVIIPLDNSRYNKYYRIGSGGHHDQHPQEQRPWPCRSRLAEHALHFFIRGLL